MILKFSLMANIFTVILDDRVFKVVFGAKIGRNCETCWSYWLPPVYFIAVLEKRMVGRTRPRRKFVPYKGF